MIRRYDVRLGVPSSVTARMTCATPGVLGITVATDVSPFVTMTRGLGVGRPPAGCGAMALTSAGPPGLPVAGAEECVVGGGGAVVGAGAPLADDVGMPVPARSEEHTSELQSLAY